MLLTRILYGAVFIIIGIVSLRFNYQLVGFTGRQDWIENKMGAGSTYFAFKMISILLILGSILYISGLGTPLLQWLVAPLKGLFNPSPTSN